MEDPKPMSTQLLQQNGLTPSVAPAALLDEIHRIQDRARRRERFWFRMACSFWIIAAACFLTLAVALPIWLFPSATPVPALNVDASTTQASVVAMPAGGAPSLAAGLMVSLVFVAMMGLPVGFIGGIVSSIFLFVARREASNAMIQRTLTTLTQQVQAMGAAAAPPTPR